MQPSILTGVFRHQFPRCRVIRTVKRIAIYARLSVGDVAIGHISIQDKRQFVVIHALMAASLGCPPIVGVVLYKPGIDINQSVIAGLVRQDPCLAFRSIASAGQGFVVSVYTHCLIHLLDGKVHIHHRRNTVLVVRRGFDGIIARKLKPAVHTRLRISFVTYLPHSYPTVLLIHDQVDQVRIFVVHNSPRVECLYNTGIGVWHQVRQIVHITLRLAACHNDR